ncbi:Fic family protein [Acidimicrobiaceae bacterium USS-CC1]|uniref:Fic family protein n=1 Tax=Acidiferrimicrobium australe TaxID=2664430 RepID=A0ABW9QNI0_9ACTN|nr:Fic family protein [Acidiferrimicrobium australe]
MSRVVRRRWLSDHSGPSRKDNRGCEYEAYVPDRLVGRAFTIDGEVAADIADAEAAIARLNAEAKSLVDTEALARILLRAESVASSRIEGLEIGARRLLRAEAARGLGDDPTDVTAVEVLGNIDAMVAAVEQVHAGDPITVDLVLGVHRRLLARTRLDRYGGVLRDQQNWIGGSGHNPCSAAFVPPPPEHVAELVADLVAFANEGALPAVAQAAIAHAQFETIHPFVDGNGRTGRALVHLIFRRRGVAPRVLPPVSLVLATCAQDYVDGLSATRYRGPASSRAAHDGTNLWIGRFATACKRAVDDAASFEERARGIEASWRERLGRVRARSAADLLLGALVGAPVVTVNSAADMISRSFVQTNEAISRLVDAGVLQQVTVGRRNRAFEAPDIIAAFTDLERQLASPEGDTHSSEPVRRVPRRR